MRDALENCRAWLSAHGRRVSVVALLAIVNLAPLAISFTSLAEYAVDDLGRVGVIAWALPIALDAGMLLALVLRWDAATRGDSPVGPTVLFYGLMAASSAANARHGSAISVDAAVVLGAMPIVGGFVGEVVLRHERRDALRAMGAIEDPLARFRLARWLVAPRETWGAWCMSVTDGHTDGRNAVEAYRASRGDADGVALPPGFEPFTPPRELAAEAPPEPERPKRRRRPSPPRPGVNIRELARDAWARADEGAGQGDVEALVHATHQGLNPATVRGAVYATRPEA